MFPYADPPPPTPPVRRSLRLVAVLAVIFSLLALLPVVIVGGVYLFQVSPQMRDDLAAQQRLLAASLVGQVGGLFSAPIWELGILGQMLAVRPPTDREATGLLDAHVAESRFYEAIYLVGDDGRVRLIGLPVAARASRNNLVGLDLSQRDFYREARARGRAVWSNSFLSPVSGRLAIAVAVPAGGRMLVGEVAIQPLPAFASRLAESNGMVIMLLDRNDQLVAHSGGKFTNQQMSLSHLPVVQAARRGDGSILTGFVFDGEAMLGSAHPIDGPDWLAVVAQPRVAALAALERDWLRLGAALVIGLTLALAAALVSARFLSRRFQRIDALVAGIADGDYRVPADPSPVVEFNDLQLNLMRMAAAVEAREQGVAEARELLRAGEQRLQATIEQTPNVAIQWVDESGSVVMWNAASDDILGVPREDAVGARFDTLVQVLEPVGGAAAIFDRVRHGGAYGPFELIFIARDGGLRTLQSTVFAIPGDRDQLCHALMSIDVSERKAAEHGLQELNATLEYRIGERTNQLTQANRELVATLETLQQAQSELVRAEKLAALGAMVAGIAHELNTPIGNGVMAVSTLEAHYRDFVAAFEGNTLRRSTMARFIADNQTAIDIIEKNLSRAGELVRRFKQVAIDQTSEQRRTFALDEVVSETMLAMHPVLRKSPFKVDLAVPPGLMFDSYPGPLGQVISNLVGNALMHAFDGRNEGRIAIYAARTGEGVVTVEVRDDGNGIAAEHAGRVFDPFFTTKLGQGGSGLGLHIVYSLVTGVLGGSVDLASTPGAGTCFTLRLPLVAPVKAPAAASHPDAGAA